MARISLPSRRTPVLACAAILLAGGCGGADTQATSSASTLKPGAATTAPAAPATQPPAVPAAAVTPSTTTAGSGSAKPGAADAGPTTTAAKSATTQAARKGADSGTTDGDRVPDGTYYGYLTEAVKANGSQAVKWDEIRFLTGQEAADEAKKQGQSSPPDNDYVIVNANKAIKTTRVAKDATITKIQGEPGNQVASPLSGVVGSPSNVYILTVKKVDGVSVITAIKQQYRP